MTEGRRTSILKNPAARLQYTYAGDGQYLSVLLDHRGRLLDEFWGTKDEVLAWMAEVGSGLPVTYVDLIRKENPNHPIVRRIQQWRQQRTS